MDKDADICKRECFIYEMNPLLFLFIHIDSSYIRICNDHPFLLVFSVLVFSHDFTWHFWFHLIIYTSLNIYIFEKRSVLIF